MKSYTKIYIDKKNEKIRQSNASSSLNQSRDTLKSSDNIYKLKSKNNLLLKSSKITERNASIITFSDLKMNNNQENKLKNSEKRVFTQEGDNNKDNSIVKKINKIGKKDLMIDIGKDRIKYRKSNQEIKNNENSINFFDDKNSESLTNELQGKEKLKQKLIEKEKKLLIKK